MKRAPLSVWIARVFLLLASVAFSMLTAVAAASDTPKAAHFMYPELLVVLPVFGFAGLFRPAWWGRRAATLGLLCVWGFALRDLWTFWSVERLRSVSLDGTYFIALFLALAITVGVPLLLIRLYRGNAASGFFAKDIAR